MKALKIIILLVFAVFFAEKSVAQSHDETGFPLKSDPTKLVQVYPNPATSATEFITLKLELPHAKRTKLQMHTIIGNTLEVETEVVDDYELRIKIKDLPSGYYLLAVHDEEFNTKNAYKFLKR